MPLPRGLIGSFAPLVKFLLTAIVDLFDPAHSEVSSNCKYLDCRRLPPRENRQLIYGMEPPPSQVIVCLPTSIWPSSSLSSAGIRIFLVPLEGRLFLFSDA